FSDQNSFEKYTSISIGVRLGQNKYSKKIIFEFLEYIQSTKNIHNIIIDADALNILSTINYWWEKLPISTLITPHIGEFNRIYKFKNYDNIFEKVTNFSKLTKLCLLLKGPTTFISQNSELIINTAPNGGMSKPGMGDVLTGLIGGLASLPKIKVKDAAIIGTYVHSNAGKLARKFKGSTSMTASDVISFIPQVFKNLEE
ncbi:MAG: NAD(P)H-hydrate dehydratase, partial [Dehalococcoidia bacterium]